MQPHLLARILNTLYRDGVPLNDLLAAAERYLADEHRLALLRPVLIAFSRIIEREQQTVTLTLPHGTTLTAAQQRAILGQHNLEDRPVTVSVADLIGGYVLEHDHTRIDHSYRSALRSWYVRCTQ